MRAEQVQAFIDVTEHGSFAAAARHTGIKRSTLSAAVNALEDSLGSSCLSDRAIAYNSRRWAKAYCRLLPAANQRQPDQKALPTAYAGGKPAVHCQGRRPARSFWRQVMHDLKQRYPLTAISVYLLPLKSTHSLYRGKPWILPLAFTPLKAPR